MSNPHFAIRMPVPIIDLFAGPGGLGEGFSSIRDEKERRVFRVAVSIEKDEVAHRTLSLRAIFRHFERAEDVPDAYYSYIRSEIPRKTLEAVREMRRAVDAASVEARCATLGQTPASTIDSWITEGIGGARDWVLIGGPPCQAYSLVGRARQTKVERSVFEQDHRHYLYREYLRIIKKFHPAIFVMENVKGILSAEIEGERIFPRILNDLRLDGEYEIRSFVVPDQPKDPRQYVIKAERYGLPQARHRVILLGVRRDYSHLEHVPLQIDRYPHCSVADVLWQLPAIRSRLSKNDSLEKWRANLKSALIEVKDLPSAVESDFTWAVEAAMSLETAGGRFVSAGIAVESCPDSDLMRWLRDTRLHGWCNHDSRGHMGSDILRYVFASTYAFGQGVSPKVHDFPRSLWPNHKNVNDAAPPFLDRFRVQLGFRESSTVVSHIAKDGHYFIHPDPSQARSMTVREAARLQTFPDNYFFEGERTDQFTQVGNAVPPFLARQVAEVVHGLLMARAAESVSIAA